MRVSDCKSNLEPIHFKFQYNPEDPWITYKKISFHTVNFFPAHCIKYTDNLGVTTRAVDIAVYLGEINNDLDTFSSTRIVVRAKQWVYHEEYEQFELYRNDIAIIHLPVNVPYGKNVRAGYVYPYDPTNPDIFDSQFLDKKAMVAGWGRHGGREDSTSPVNLEFTQISVTSRADCKNEFPGITVNQICTRTANAERVQVIKKVC
jgi:hypothetical protein